MAEKTYEITIEDGRFNHGEMKTKQISSLETAVKVYVELVIYSDNAEELRRDITKIIEKYAI